MPETWEFPGSTLVRVVDGDTFIARVGREYDAGFHLTLSSSSVQRFRLARTAAAPLNTDSGAGAAQAVREWLSYNGPFHVTSLGPYKYGDEWMAEVVLASGMNLSDWMIANQWAAVWSGKGTQPRPPWPRTVSVVPPKAGLARPK